MLQTYGRAGVTIEGGRLRLRFVAPTATSVTLRNRVGANG
jgi:hypothetical protein